MNCRTKPFRPAIWRQCMTEFPDGVLPGKLLGTAKGNPATIHKVNNR